MKFRIQADPEGGFSVIMLGLDGKTPVATIAGFGTDSAAQVFIKDVMIGMMIAMAPKH